jgi:hypothetical protein
LDGNAKVEIKAGRCNWLKSYIGIVFTAFYPYTTEKITEMYKQIIEVELRDLRGKTYLQEKKDAQNLHLISKFENRITEEVGGMLCMNHFHLPDCEPVYTRRRWVVKVTCCCQEQMDQVEHRLNTAFK